MNLDFLSVVGGVRSRRPDVIFDVGGVEEGVEQRDESGDAFERKSLRAEIAGLHDLLEEIGADEAFENFGLVNGRQLRLEVLGDPAAALRVEQVHEIGADRSAVITASFLRGGTCELLEVGRGDWLKKA